MNPWTAIYHIAEGYLHHQWWQYEYGHCWVGVVRKSLLNLHRLCPNCLWCGTHLAIPQTWEAR